MSDHLPRLRGGLAALTSIVVLAGPTATAAAATPSEVLLRADSNRDGRLTADDDAGDDTWTAARGAIMLPNVDDDQSSCRTTGPKGARLSDAVLAACNDAADEVVNGAADLADLARLEIPAMPHISPEAEATVVPDVRSRGKVRLFVEREGKWVTAGRISANELRRGVRLAIEARDVIRDPAVWSGVTDLTLTVVSSASTRTDRVRLRVAPVLFQHDLLPLERAVVASPEAPETLEGRKAARKTVPGAQAYRRDLRRALNAAGLHKPSREWPAGGDQWIGDMYKAAYASMPGPDGKEHRIVVDLRSPAVMPKLPARDRPLRDASRPVFTKLRGPGVAGVQQFDAARVDQPDVNLYYGSPSSPGNFGTIPPHQGYPTGRIVYGGAGRFSPDPAFTKMLAAQGYQDPVVVDTGWLGVGHLDEFLHFVPARNKRGWAAVVADPRMAMKLLQDLAGTGGGNRRLVQGVKPAKTDHPAMTVSQAVRDKALVNGTRIAAQGVDKALRQLREQADITEDDIVRIPVLYTKVALPKDYPRQNVTAAYLPNAANGVSTGTGGYLAPKQHGPRRAGADVFAEAIERALQKVGVRVHWIEDWDYAHHVGTVGGDIHCVTNVERDLSTTTSWWNTPRS
ncbi:protein-arginine deiminase family protein [Nonomuraea sp. NPDC000554]|uniref:protein-arginine deiminase family protein n=1 Tax=Nonomuraea sp. NPDC000554 TaxID=3154259 RepID=UPI00332C17A6